MRTLLVAILTIIIFSACRKDNLQDFNNINEEDPQLRSYPNVEEALWIYFQRFEEEAALRGITIDLSDGEIHGVIREISQEHVAGSCNFNSHRTDLVTIDREFWDTSSDALREAVVFHELGHCKLVRDHREGSDQSGNCISLMASGTENCRQSYHAANRTNLLDELFDPEFRGDWFN